ncbi:Uncharacterized protein TDE2370, clustered with polyferredoxin [Olavius algarvensis associated proteobacterium Delta 3]|nr:Uncharacterized protein TDE2370, clustered with polyferredoxin [Olavius algarvensis associated proteobacterium Delta 3]CAB5167955.1 Uncharacterized protein TDE2370, clustered with polyferredoxin [Olavius algarvensis associated proteobacterium Delta 3]
MTFSTGQLAKPANPKQVKSMQQSVNSTPGRSPGRRSPFIVMVVFLLLFIIGINLGEVPVVLAKAIRLCLSCIGIG